MIRRCMDGIPVRSNCDIKAAICYHADISNQKTTSLDSRKATVATRTTVVSLLAANIAEACMVLARRGCLSRISASACDSAISHDSRSSFVTCITSTQTQDAECSKLARVGINASSTSSLDKLLTLRIPVPPLPTQRKIAAILSAYDDLIENNLRRIKILEEMAQNLYREWFVKFRFPGHEKVKLVNSRLRPNPGSEDYESHRHDCR